tara:strand:- start:22 stop:1191 length:1170 start_codon:yes stop_codon:yes gene_type:complete
MINLNEPYDVYVATEVGSVSHGGVSLWVDYWVNNVAPYLITKPILIIEVEQTDEWDVYVKQFVDVIHRPGSDWEWEYTMSQLPIANYFSLPDRRTVDMVINGARKFHLLSYPLPIKYQGDENNLPVKKMREIYKRDIDSFVCHSLERETIKFQMDTIKFPKKVKKYMKNSIDFQNLLLKDAKLTAWIGVDEDDTFDYHIPNFYEFKHNLPATESNIVGFPARSEPRKNLNFLKNSKSLLFTSEKNFDTYINITKTKFKSVEVIDYKRENIENFYLREDWGISHSCFESEPFGYSIFQSVDYGKLPIIHKNWCKDMKYPFRASTQKQFETQVAKISKLSLEEKNTYLNELRDYLSKFSSKEKWRNDLLSIYNEDGNQVWLPTDLSPSKSV